MHTYVVRVWLPDRPGALGAVAARIGAVGGDVVGIDILERGAGQVIDELVVELPGIDGPIDALVALMVDEMHQVDEVDVEEVTAVGSSDTPRIDALDAAVALVATSTAGDAVGELCRRAISTVGADWGVVVELASGAMITGQGDAPSADWVAAFVAGGQSSDRVRAGMSGPDDVVWAPLATSAMALVLGRNGPAFRSRERRQAAALARIVDIGLAASTGMDPAGSSVPGA